MEWHVRFASDPKEIKLWQKFERQGRDNPLRHMPVLPPEAEAAWHAFWKLHQHRPATAVGVGSIPFSEIAAYLDLLGEEQVSSRQWLFELITCLDEHWFRFRQQQKEAGDGN